MAMAPAVRLFLMLYFTDFAERQPALMPLSSHSNETEYRAAESNETHAYLSYHHATRQLYRITDTKK